MAAQFGFSPQAQTEINNAGGIANMVGELVYVDIALFPIIPRSPFHPISQCVASELGLNFAFGASVRVNCLEVVEEVPCEDDEDGIAFVTPLIPGAQACIQVTALNETGENAVLQGWIDWNGNGSLEEGEELEFTNNGIVPDGGVDEANFCFEVPEDAEFNDGNVYARFRLSPEGELESSGPDKFDDEEEVPQGEVEDYFIKLAKVGNIVWFDRDADGYQDDDELEYGINDIPMTMIYLGEDGELGGGDDIVYDENNVNVVTDYDPRTGRDGVYYFCGLIPGQYQITMEEPDGLNLTMPNAGTQEDRDSDGEQSDPNEVVIEFEVLDPMGMPQGEDGIADQILDGNITDVNAVAGFPDMQVAQDLDIGLIAVDYGDLPVGYPTTMEENGPRHTVPNELVPDVPLLYLGELVDIDEDGQRDNMGMAGGDDEDTDAPDDGDDEDGVELVTPLIAGYEACVNVTSNIPAGEVAFLNVWFDFNGNGAFDDGDHAVNNYALVAGTNVETRVCFDVPEFASFSPGGLAFARFRLTTDPVAGVSPVGGAPDGEVEDYKFELGKLGNLVWEDENFNGLQDDGETGLNDVPVVLVYAGEDGELGTNDDLEYAALTSRNDGQDGLYYFCGLIAGEYKVVVQTPEDMTPSRPNVDGNNEDETDSDGVITDMDLTMVMTDPIWIDDVTDLPINEDGIGDQGEVSGYPDNQVDETNDFAFAGLDYGDLPQEEDDQAFNTTMEEEGPVHVLTDELFLGTCADAERDGQPDDDAGAFDGEDGDQGEGDDGTDSEFSNPDDEECEDDEDGIEFVTPLVPGNEACIAVTAFNETGEAAVLQGWIDWNGNGEFDDDEELEFTNNGTVPNGGVAGEPFCFQVPDLDLADFLNEGNVYARFRLSPAGELEADGPDKFDEAEVVPQGEVEDYFIKTAKIGNLVWEDRNYNGLQDAEEEDLGINDVAVTLLYAGVNGEVETDLAAETLVAGGDDILFETVTGIYEYEDGETKDGIYYFCGLIDGTYDVIVGDPKDLTPSKPNNITNSQDEDQDSDGLVVDGALRVHVGEFTIADQMEIMQLAEGEEGIGDQDLSNLLDVNMVGNYPDMQVDQRFDFGYAAFDFGDLPEGTERPDGEEVSYNTSLEEGGPYHIVKPDFYLGACADAEIDGEPDHEAGYKGNARNEGDDALDLDNDSWKQGEACADDEDGVEFVTPLIPGYEACIEIKYTLPDNFDGPDGYLNVWMDFDGSGSLDEDEKISFKTVNGDEVNNVAPRIEPNTGALELENIFMTDGEGVVTLCFDVPEDAQYLKGDLYTRFRLSDDPRLGPDGILPPDGSDVNRDGVVPCGEVEDYFVPLTKVGNLVWEDRDFDGIQDAEEEGLGLNDVQVYLVFKGDNGDLESDFNEEGELVAAGDDRVYETKTGVIDDVNGLYYFCGLIEYYNYKLIVVTPEDMTPTRPNRLSVNQNDELDSDFADGLQTDQDVDDVLAGMVMLDFTISDADGQPEDEAGVSDDHGTAPDYVIGEDGFVDEQVNETYDAGFAGLDYGDLADDPDNDDDFQTLMDEEGAVHVINPGVFLGTCVDAEREGAPDEFAGEVIEKADPVIAEGDDNTDSEFGYGEECDDDEDGITFLKPLIQGYETCIQVDYTVPDGETWYLKGWTDENANDKFDPGEEIDFITNRDGDGNPIAVAQAFELTPGAGQSAELCWMVPDEDDLYEGGAAYFRFRLTKDADLGPNGPAKYGPDEVPVPMGEVEDYYIPLAKIGNLAWFDYDVDGAQDGEASNPQELGIAGTKIYLYHAGYGDTQFDNGNDDKYEIDTDADGRYYFCGLIPGKYLVVPEKYDNIPGGYLDPEIAHLVPEHFILTIPNNTDQATEDDLDSDGVLLGTTPERAGAMVMIPDLTEEDLVNGSDADPQNENGYNDEPGQVNGYPDVQDDQMIDFGWIPEPNIEGMACILGVDFPQSLECGHFNVTADVCIKNTGYVEVDGVLAGANLETLQAMLNLDGANAFGNAFLNVVGVPEIVADKTTATTQPTVNNLYDGRGNKNLLNGNSGLLKPGEVVCIRVTFEVNPEAAGAPIQPKLQAMVSGKAVNDAGQAVPDLYNGGVQFMATDLSDDCERGEDLVPDESFEGGYHDMDDPTELDDCWKTLPNLAQNDAINITLDDNCVAVLTADMFLEDHRRECDSRAYPLGGFYRIVLINEDGGYASEVDDVIHFNAKDWVGKQIKVQMVNVAKFCEPSWGYANFEDKTPPEVVECAPAEIRQITVEKQVQTLSSSISGSDQLKFNSFSCFIEQSNLQSCANGRNYDVIGPIQVNESDDFTFELDMPDAEGMIALYRGAFRSNEPCANIIGQSDQVAYTGVVADDEEGRIRLGLPLQPEDEYYILVTTSGNDCNALGEDYTIYAFSDEGGEIVYEDEEGEPIAGGFSAPEGVERTYDLLCTDVDYILDNPESLQYTGNRLSWTIVI